MAPPCTSVTSVTTRLATCWRAIAACRAITCSTRWDGTPLDCRPKITPSKTRSVRASPSIKTRRASKSSSSKWASAMTGRAKSTAPTPNITAGRSGYSCSSSKKDWLTSTRACSGGARSTKPSWPTNRSKPAGVGAAVIWSRRSRSSSGSSKSPTTPTACSMTSKIWTGPRPSNRCSATGSAARAGPRSLSRWSTKP